MATASRAAAVVHFTVGPAGQGGQYATIQEAVDAVAGTTTTPSTVRHVIDILPGTYTGRVRIPAHKPYITLRGLGQNAGDTVVTFNETQNTLPNENTNHATVVMLSKDCIAQNLTFANSFGNGAQALALHARGDRLVFENVRFLGNQDTLRSEQGRHYFNDAYVEGTVDFIYGKGTAYFEHATILAKSSGYFTAQARESAMDLTGGFVFENATLTGATASVKSYLGRPWAEYARTVFLNSKLGPVVQSTGWSTWDGRFANTYYAEYQSRDLSGVLLTPAQLASRVSWSKQLTAEQAAAFTKTAWLGGSDNWNPQAPAPGDFNGDGAVDADDLGVLSSGWGLAGNLATGDADRDGLVNGADFLIWQQQALAGGAATAVPEPGSAALAAIGGLVAIRRRQVQ